MNMQRRWVSDWWIKAAIATELAPQFPGRALLATLT
jgi:hypothetical protein